MNKLTTAEVSRYSRHLNLPGFGHEGQQKLIGSRVLVIGAGGLGCPALQYLAAAGVGTLGIVDGDLAEESNLQRQVLYNTSDIGKPKASLAAHRLTRLNPHVAVQPHVLRLTAHNALELCKAYDLIIDGSDNFPTRYLINDACVLLDKPWVYGAVFRYEGQLSVFNTSSAEGRSNTYRDVFPSPPSPGEVLNCEESGVLGALPGLIGCLMAMEAMKLITGTGQPLRNTLVLWDGLTAASTRVRTPNGDQRLRVTKLIDYDVFCGLKSEARSAPMKEVTVQELKSMMDTQVDFQLIDVREVHENEAGNLGGELIPMAEVPHNLGKIDKAKKVVVHCRSGGRSGNIIQWLEKNYGYENLYNLKGGIMAWAKEIDPSVTVV